MLIVKTCRKHGELTREQVRKITYKGKSQNKCIQCEKLRSKKYYDANRDAKRKKDNEYWAKNKTEITKRRQDEFKLAKRREWAKKNKERLAPFYAEKQKKYKDELAAPYIKKVIQNGNKNIKFNQIPSIMIELKVISIKTKRLLKERKFETKLEKLNEVK